MSDTSSISGPACLVDLDGVIYNDETAIPGAAETIAWLRKRGIPHLFLTNTTSRPRSALVEKLGAMGIEAEASRILTPPVAANRWLKRNIDGPVALFVARASEEEFADLEIAPREDPGAGAAVVIGDYSDSWTFAELNRAFRLLMTEPQPRLIALGMTRYWHAAEGLRLDVAPFVVALQHASGIEPTVLGKPARPFFEMALAELGEQPVNTWMIGDDIRGDIDGAQRAGMQAILVQTGKFRPGDLELGIEPAAILQSIAELPDWWDRQLQTSKSD
jgi:phospholysine phosphohistidine inorganic pyrophosphate phosphatase